MSDFDFDPRAGRYYRGLGPLSPLDPHRVERAISDGWTRVEEWSYEQDAHGYCHDRTDWIALLLEIKRLRSVVTTAGLWDETRPNSLIRINYTAKNCTLGCSDCGEVGHFPLVQGETEGLLERFWQAHLADKHSPAAEPPATKHVREDHDFGDFGTVTYEHWGPKS